VIFGTAVFSFHASAIAFEDKGIILPFRRALGGFVFFADGWRSGLPLR
jgi:hypothetical protein